VSLRTRNTRISPIPVPDEIFSSTRLKACLKIGRMH
jgi:hypothetical protein